MRRRKVGKVKKIIQTPNWPTFRRHSRPTPPNNRQSGAAEEWCFKATSQQQLPDLSSSFTHHMSCGGAFVLFRAFSLWAMWTVLLILLLLLELLKILPPAAARAPISASHSIHILLIRRNSLLEKKNADLVHISASQHFPPSSIHCMLNVTVGKFFSAVSYKGEKNTKRTFNRSFT